MSKASGIMGIVSVALGCLAYLFPVVKYIEYYGSSNTFSYLYFLSGKLEITQTPHPTATIDPVNGPMVVNTYVYLGILAFVLVVSLRSFREGSELSGRLIFLSTLLLVPTAASLEFLNSAYGLPPLDFASWEWTLQAGFWIVVGAAGTGVLGATMAKTGDISGTFSMGSRPDFRSVPPYLGFASVGVLVVTALLSTMFPVLLFSDSGVHFSIFGFGRRVADGVPVTEFYNLTYLLLAEGVLVFLLGFSSIRAFYVDHKKAGVGMIVSGGLLAAVPHVSGILLGRVFAAETGLPPPSFSLGLGFYLVLVAVALGIVGGILALKKTKSSW
ncbi:MAG: hypothetical protein ACTSU5_13730 [Promethearchaeota archaeon]